jgi:hypothetical protein
VRSQAASAQAATEVRKKAIIQAVADPAIIQPVEFRFSGQTTATVSNDEKTRLGQIVPTQRPQNCVLGPRTPEPEQIPERPELLGSGVKIEPGGAKPSTLMEVEGFLPKTEDELFERIEMLFAPEITGFHGEPVQEHELDFQIVRMLSGFFEGDKTKALDFTGNRLGAYITIESAESIWHRLTAPAWAMEKALGYSSQEWDHPFLCRTLHYRSRTRQLAQASYLLQKIQGADSWFLLNQKTLATLLSVTQQDIARMLSSLVRVEWLKRRKRAGSRSLEYQCLGHINELENGEE